MTWQLPDTYHLAGHGRGTATFKFYEGRDILDERAAGKMQRSVHPGRPVRAEPYASIAEDHAVTS
jgi:hypothetical protein